MSGRVVREQVITRSMLRACPDTLFLFGDNMQRRGLGGQAHSMRGEPNALGVPTKWSPTRDQAAYFCDGDADYPEVRAAIIGALDAAEQAINAGKDVVIPSAGLGTGLAELPLRAPRIQRYIDARIARMERR